jgi:hypothetical protein
MLLACGSFMGPAMKHSVQDDQPQRSAGTEMSLIDWSDPVEMFGLLIDYVADEAHGTEDAGRRMFLSRLTRELEALQERFEQLPLGAVISCALAIRREVEPEFEDDPVVGHLGDCIEELERVRAESGDAAP